MSGEEHDDCLICLQPAVAPTRLSCACKFSCCQSCILEWVQTARNTEATSSCPLCRRSDVKMITEEGGEDLSDKVCTEGYQLIAKWEKMRAPLPPAKFEEKDSGAEAGERQISYTPTYNELETEEAHERRFTLAWAAYKGAEATFKKPLKEALSLFMKAICANAQNSQGYIGVAYLSLLVSDQKTARRYLEHVLKHVDDTSEDAKRLLEYIDTDTDESNEALNAEGNTETSVADVVRNTNSESQDGGAASTSESQKAESQ